MVSWNGKVYYSASFLFFVVIVDYCKVSSSGRDQTVTYWPSTEPSIKRCASVNKQKNSEDIGISPWSVDVVEFGADAYAHGKQVDIKQLYNQVPQTAWVSSVPVAVGVSWGQDASMRISLQTESLWPSVTHGWASQPECERSATMVRRTCSTLSPSLIHLSHTTNINPFE